MQVGEIMFVVLIVNLFIICVVMNQFDEIVVFVLSVDSRNIIVDRISMLWWLRWLVRWLVLNVFIVQFSSIDVILNFCIYLLDWNVWCRLFWVLLIMLLLKLNRKLLIVVIMLISMISWVFLLLFVVWFIFFFLSVLLLLLVCLLCLVQQVLVEQVFVMFLFVVGLVWFVEVGGQVCQVWQVECVVFEILFGVGIEVCVVLCMLLFLW